MPDSGSIREDLALLRRRFAKGEIDETTYQRQRELILADVSPEDRALIERIPTPRPTPATPPARTPGSGSGVRVGSGSGAHLDETRLPDRVVLDLPEGTVLGRRFRLVGLLGVGGMGAVWVAEDAHLERQVALKVLFPRLAGTPEGLQRFKREVSLAQRLAHDRIVRVHDYGEDPATTLKYFTMELIEGCTLREVIGKYKEAGKTLPVPLALAIADQLFEALEHAHGRKPEAVIHRDIKPGNVIVRGGTPELFLDHPDAEPDCVLVDFGIAGLLSRSELSESSRVLGTVAYVAPEVYDASKPIGPQADLYSLGAVLYEMLTGLLPMGRFRLPGELGVQVPKALDELVDRMLERDPGRRPASIAEVRAELARSCSLPRRDEEVRRTTGVSAKVGHALTDQKAGRPPASESSAGETRRLPEELYKTEPEARRGSRSLAVVIALVCALVGIASLGIWLKEKRGWIFQPPPPTPTPAPTASPTPPMVTPAAKPRPTAAAPAGAFVNVSANVEGVQVLIDGVRVGLAPRSVELSPGRHLVEASKQGCGEARQWVQLRAGERLSVDLEITCPTPTPTRSPTPRPLPLPTVPQPRPTPMPPRPRQLEIADANAKWANWPSTDPRLAIDGNISTGYSSADAHDWDRDKDMWWEADLGVPSAISRIEVYWAPMEERFYKEIKIDGSLDGRAFDELVPRSRVSLDGSWTTFHVSGRYRYLRVRYVGSGAGGHGLDLMEFRVYE